MAGLLDRVRAVFLAAAGAEDEAARQRTLTDLADVEGDRTARYGKFEGYYDGEFGAKLTGRLKAYLEVNGFGYVENFCETIVDALALCLELNGIVVDVPDAGEPDERFEEWLSRAWQANNMEETQGVVHTQVPMKGDGFVLVDWNQRTGLPRFTWNDPKLLKPVYDEHGNLVVVAKAWPESARAVTNPGGRPIRRLNLYFPDRVEKWFTTSTPSDAMQSAIWQPHVDYSDVLEPVDGADVGEARWPVPWIDAAGEPLGILAIHFRNKPKGRPFGRSELASVIPQQNYLTKQLVDLADVLDYQGAAQRWATGVSEDSKFTSAAGTVWTAVSPDATFGQFEPADPRGIQEAVESTIRRMASRSQTPLHQLMTGGQNPTGETLRAANEPKVKKARDRMTSYGGSWVAAWVLAARLQALHDPTFELPEDLVLKASWESPESADVAGDLDAAEAKHRLGVSKRTLLTELGYDPDVEAKQRAAERAAGEEDLVRMFRRGVTDDVDEEPSVDDD